MLSSQANRIRIAPHVSRADRAFQSAGTLLVPSLVLGERLPDAYAMRLVWADAAIDLAPIRVLEGADFRAPAAHMDRMTAGTGVARGGLDCVTVEAPIDDARLELRGSGDVPVDAVLLLGTRARHMVVEDDAGVAAELPVPSHSQMTRSAEIARHVCSPLCVAMVLGAGGRSVDPERFARACEHPDHAKLFGMWPLNLSRARLEGFGGMVRQFTHVSEVVALLSAGHPIVASIRFEAGALPGAPLERTGGHLVVLRGLDEDAALVNDPAGATDDEVARRYDRRAFLEAWLADRGIGYVLWRRGDALDAAQAHR